MLRPETREAVHTLAGLPVDADTADAFKAAFATLLEALEAGDRARCDLAEIRTQSNYVRSLCSFDAVTGVARLELEALHLMIGASDGDTQSQG